jgi:hypothetical protein
MTASGQRTCVENVAASGPTGAEQTTTVMQPRGALCILCGGETQTLVVIAIFESMSNSGVIMGCGYCAELLGKRASA